MTRPAIPTANSDHLTLPGIACGCGSSELRMVAPGDAPEAHDLIGLLAKGSPIRGWCSFQCFDKRRIAA